jgi:hypothetical protein
MRKNGNTILEKWTLMPLTYDTSADKIIPGTRSAVEVLYDGKVAGKDLVHNIANYPGLPGPQFLLHSHDSKECWRFDASTQAFVKVASPTGEPGVLAVPELNNTFVSLGSTNTVQHGYLFHFKQSALGLPGKISLGVFDHDRNGTLDGYVLFTPELWSSMGLHDGANYLPQ